MRPQQALQNTRKYDRRSCKEGLRRKFILELPSGAGSVVVVYCDRIGGVLIRILAIYRARTDPCGQRYATRTNTGLPVQTIQQALRDRLPARFWCKLLPFMSPAGQLTVVSVRVRRALNTTPLSAGLLHIVD
jgi:hypothetical protein